MEPLGTCELCLNAPRHGMKIHGICMDDDQTTRAQLQADEGPATTGRTPAKISRDNIFSDPSHQKKLTTMDCTRCLTIKWQNDWESIFTVGLGR